MNENDNGTVEVYEQKVGELAPKLDLLGRVTKVIWLIQYPSNDAFDSIHNNLNSVVSQNKINHFNQAAQQIFQ